jgi:hypothetical protein
MRRPHHDVTLVANGMTAAQIVHDELHPRRA